VRIAGAVKVEHPACLPRLCRQSIRCNDRGQPGCVIDGEILFGPTTWVWGQGVSLDIRRNPSFWERRRPGGGFVPGRRTTLGRSVVRRRR